MHCLANELRCFLRSCCVLGMVLPASDAGKIFKCAGSFAFDFEEQELDEAALRAHVWAEMARYQAPAGAKLPAPR